MPHIYDSLDALAADKGKAPLMESSIHSSTSRTEMGGPGAFFHSDSLSFPSLGNMFDESLLDPALVADGPQETRFSTTRYERQNSLLETCGLVPDCVAPHQSYCPAEYGSNRHAVAHDQDYSCIFDAETVNALEYRFYNQELREGTPDSAPYTGAVAEEGMHYDTQMQGPQAWSQNWMTTDQSTYPPFPPSSSSAVPSSASTASTQSDSYPATPSPPPVPGTLAVPAIHGEMPSYRPAEDSVGTPSVRRNRYYPTDSERTLNCPFLKENGEPCGVLLIHNEKFLHRHINEHYIAGQLPPYVMDCALCTHPNRQRLPPGKKVLVRRGLKKSSLQSFVRHIYTIHFGGGRNWCFRCSKSLSRRDALQRHMDAHRAADRKAEQTLIHEARNKRVGK